MSGITANTVERLLRNLAGALTVNAVAMGAYEEGDVAFEPELEYDAPQFGGAWGIIAGSEIVSLAGGRLTINMKESHYAALSVYFGELGYDSTGTSEQIGGRNFASNPFRKLLGEVVFAGMIRGGPGDTQAVKIVMVNAVMGPPPLTLSGKASATFPVVFEVRYAAGTPGTYPVSIYLEKP